MHSQILIAAMKNGPVTLVGFQFGKPLEVSHKVHIHLPYDLAMLLLGSYPTEMKPYNHAKISM